MPDSSTLTPEIIRDQLRAVLCPGTKRDIVSIDLVGSIDVSDGDVLVQIVRTTEKPELIGRVRDLVHQELTGRSGIKSLRVEILQRGRNGEAASGGATATGGPAADTRAAAAGATGAGHPAPAPDPWADRQPLAGVKHIVAVASAKGGVGKSSIAVNLALALQQHGRRTGLLDADMYGPSLPTMLAVRGQPTLTADHRLRPILSHGLQVMSIGFWLDPTQPVVWRGPMVFSQVKQFLRDVAWDDLDFLIVDLPPGTGDAQLTLIQQVPLAGVIMVTTPQEIALADVRRGIRMFQSTKVAVPVLGIVENMSRFVCPESGKSYDIFGSGGGRAVAEQFGVPLLGEIPIDVTIREGGDHGRPAVENPDSPARAAFLELAEKVASRVR